MEDDDQWAAHVCQVRGEESARGPKPEAEPILLVPEPRAGTERAHNLGREDHELRHCFFQVGIAIGGTEHIAQSRVLTNAFHRSCKLV